MTPPLPRFVSYLRVSTDGQGRSGLGLDEQRQAVATHVAAAGGQLVAEFQEIESGKRADRPALYPPFGPARALHAVAIPLAGEAAYVVDGLFHHDADLSTLTQHTDPCRASNIITKEPAAQNTARIRIG